VAFGGIFGASARRILADEYSETYAANGRLARVQTLRPRQIWPNDVCPELECIRHLLPQRILAAAEHRAQSIGVGADRVLICADAITEEAYLAALAASLGTSFESLDAVARADCPLDDEQLLRAPAAGLLPLRKRGKIIWIVAVHRLTARHFADPHRSLPYEPQSFRLTSSERLLRFVMRHAQDALGRSATESLRRARPHLSNAPPRRAGRNLPSMMLALLAVGVLTFLAAAKVEAFAVLLSIAFLATAGLRLSTARYTDKAPTSSRRIGDDELPIYTIICALYREEKVVGDLAAAIRALDYPGIMAQTPLNRTNHRI
jgi:glycosyltransferase XagB